MEWLIWQVRQVVVHLVAVAVKPFDTEIDNLLASERSALKNNCKAKWGLEATRYFWKEEVKQSINNKIYEDDTSALHGKQLQEPDC